MAVRHPLIALLSSAAVLAALPSAAAAIPGDVDGSFGSAGLVTTNIGTTPVVSGFDDLTIDSSGRIVAVGESELDFSLARFTPSGQRDSSFGDGGQVMTDVGSDSVDTATSVAIDASDRILVAGSSNGDFALARYHADGSLDTSFGGDGIVTTQLGSGGSINGLAIDGSGRIVAVGEANPGSFTSDIAVARYVPSGSLDATFSGDGIVTTDLGDSSGANGVTVASNGSIVVAGSSRPSRFDTTYFTVLRYTAAGALDSSFDGDGVAVFGAGEAAEVAIDSNGRIVAAGGRGQDFAVVRYTASGALDSAFGGGDGFTTTDISGAGSGDFGSDLVLDASENIVVCGWTSDVTGTEFALARYTASGTLDSEFDGDGIVTTDITPGWDQANGLVLDRDGRAVVAGAVGGEQFFGDQYGLVRYNANGSLDSGFDGDGIVTGRFRVPSREGVQAITKDGAGRLLVTGFTDAGGAAGGFGPFVARYAPSGTLDDTFGDGGIALLGDGVPGGADIAIDGEGRIVLAGETDAGDFAVARLLPSGALDTTFSGDGVATADPGPASAVAESVMIDVGGRIVIAGDAGGDFAVARLRGSGAPDSSFAGDGTVTTDLGAGRTDDVNDATIDSQGRIVVAGRHFVSGGSDLALVRYTPGGALDSTFDGDGVLTDEFGSTHNGIEALGVRPDGRIFAIGVVSSGTGDRTLSILYDDAGQLVNFYRQDLGRFDSPEAVVLDTQGRAYAAGAFGASDFAVGRVFRIFSDSSFGSGGFSAVDLGSRAFVDDLVLAANSRVVLAGWRDDDIVLVGFLAGGGSLGVNAEGSGSGTITGPGINCPGDCTETYDEGAAVTLTAEPAPGSTFTGWSGDCSGTGSCTLTIDRSRAVSATFAAPGGAGGGGSTPSAKITDGPKKKTKKKQATFEFTSTPPGLDFECKIDKEPFESCTSPKTYKVKPGKHTFKVRVADPAGNTDGDADVYAWKVKKKKK